MRAAGPGAMSVRTREVVGFDQRSIVERCAAEMARWGLRGKRVVVVAPDHTRTAPMDVVLRALGEVLRAEGASFDVLIALGTHPPMTDEAIDRRFGLASGDRRALFPGAAFHNHAWQDPRCLASVGKISAEEVHVLSRGWMREAVDVTVNRRLLDADLVLIAGPTFPHEVVGFSGGNKYLVPGVSGQPIIDLLHWLGALITSPVVIGTKHTPVRAVVDRAAAMIPVARKCVSLVVDEGALVGVFVGTPEEAWSAAADLSSERHVRRVGRAYASVLSCAPPMYEELWVGAKCAYKLEPVVADGGELVIYAPHLQRISATHGDWIRRVGYHVRDYFTAQMDRFADVPRGILAHSTHVRGAGTYDGGVERPRVRVTLATGIPEAECRAVGLGFRDFRDIDVEAWAGREPEGVLLVRRAGEILYRLGEGS